MHSRTRSTCLNKHISVYLVLLLRSFLLYFCCFSLAINWVVRSSAHSRHVFMVPRLQPIVWSKECPCSTANMKVRRTGLVLLCVSVSTVGGGMDQHRRLVYDLYKINPQ